MDGNAGDGLGDLCDTETCDGQDNDGDTMVDEGFVDGDGDGVADCVDLCPLLEDADQEDRDLDGLGDVCDLCPDDPDNHADGDGVCGNIDNCPENPNPGAATHLGLSFTERDETP